MCSVYGDCWKKGALHSGIFMPEIEWRADKMPEQSFVDLTNSSFLDLPLTWCRAVRFRSEPHQASSSPLLSFISHTLSITHSDRCALNTLLHTSFILQDSSELILDFKLSSVWTASQSLSLAHVLSCDCAPHVIFSCASFASCVMFSLVCCLARWFSVSPCRYIVLMSALL